MHGLLSGEARSWWLARSRPKSLRPVARLRAGIGVALIEVHQYRADRLLQRELVLADGLVQGQLHHEQPNVVLFLRALDVNVAGELDAVIVLEHLVAGLGDRVSLIVVGDLPMGPEVGAIEDDLARQDPALSRSAGSRPKRSSAAAPACGSGSQPPSRYCSPARRFRSGDRPPAATAHRRWPGGGVCPRDWRSP